MQLDAFRPRHFQSLYDPGWVPFHDITVLIGENDGGKTASLLALGILFGDSRPDQEDFSFVPGAQPNQDGDLPREPEMTLEARFTLSKEEQAMVAKHAPLDGGILHIGKNFTTAGEDEHYIVGQVPQDEKLRVDLDGLKIQGLRQLAGELGLEVGGTSKEPFVQALREHRAQQPTVEGKLPFPSGIRSLIPEFTAVNTASDPEAVVHGVLRLTFREELDKPENAQRLQELEHDITNRLREQASALNPFVQKYRPEVKSVSVNPEFNFERGFQASRLTLLDQNDRPILLEKRGTGIRRHITLAVYEWNSQVIRKREEEGARPLILALDEPDTSLDYHSQRQLFDIIQGFVGPKVQVVVCTHSVNLINRVPVQKINHYLLDPTGSKTIVESFQVDSEDQEEIDFFLHRLGDGIGLQNALMFYERCFLLFEGETEKRALPLIFRLCTGEFPYAKGVRLANAYNDHGAIVFAKFLHRHRRDVVFMVDEDTTRNIGVKRHITRDSLERAGFNVAEQAHFIGPDHFEYAFSDELWARALGSYEGSGSWTPERVASLRDPPQHFATRLLEESGIQSKPDLGLVLAKSLRSADEVPDCIRACVQRAEQMAG